MWHERLAHGVLCLPALSPSCRPSLYCPPIVKGNARMPLVIIKSDPRAREKPCLRCGYSLRKITDSNYCPECGLSVWLSLNQNDTLEMSNPDWLRRMALGLWVLAAASVIALAVLTPVTIQSFQTMLFRQRFYAALRQGRLDDEEP